ncbi:hypothetical protein Bhyg_04189 [Pseudolycoriella hygida]|uniref:Uncharacterized protein n=1 Tax=Pseudolycoriella hygida TaxID=35572 RepID=A0A9Q0NFL6_9DIPT|nr:hypothetical protein Bhyg_04189 [Pseudolycoriella hygida]
MISVSLISLCCVCMFIQTVTADDDVVVIEGRNVNSSDIKAVLGNRNRTKIYVYVVDTFYVDEDLKLNGIKELQIFANTWYVERPVTFDLSGSDGESQEAESEDGLAGNPGNDGMDGGNFLALANEVTGINYLTVISNGGNGGDGQEGTGSDDVYVLLNANSDLSNSGWFSSGEDLVHHFKNYFNENGYISEINDINDHTSLYAVFVHNKKVSFNIRLHPWKCCGSIGMGGVGGLGGERGNLVFLHVGDSPSHDRESPTFVQIDGSIGKIGTDGRTCVTYALDVKVDIELKKVILIFLPLHHSFSTEFTILSHTNSSECPPVFVSVNPEEVNFSEPNNPIENIPAVIGYKRFLLQNMRNASLIDVVQRTYKAIDENQDITREYSVKDLVLEACELEENYFELKQFTDMDSLFQSLFDKAERLELRNMSRDEERALAQLRLILKFKSYDLKESSILILNIEAYVETMISNIENRNDRLPTITNINDMDLINNLNRLRFAVNRNFILGVYHHVIKEFQRTYFPFAVEYLEAYSILTTGYNNLDDIISTSTTNLNTLIKGIPSTKNREIWKDLNQIDYTSPGNALFIWKNVDVRDKVRELFDGKRVKLFADVKLMKERFNAFKYNKVDLVFRAADKTVNDQLNEVLQSFDLFLNHTGQSVIRCNRNFYQIRHDWMSTLTSFKKDGNQLPLSHTLIDDKLRDNEPTFSPFALWEVQLIVIEKAYPTELARLGHFDINIELHGTGNFIEENASICENENLSKFFMKINN